MRDGGGTEKENDEDRHPPHVDRHPPHVRSPPTFRPWLRHTVSACVLVARWNQLLVNEGRSSFLDD